MIDPPQIDDLTTMMHFEVEINWYEDHARKLSKRLSNAINAIGGVVPSCTKVQHKRMPESPVGRPACTIEGYIDGVTYGRLQAVFRELPKAARKKQNKIEQARVDAEKPPRKQAFVLSSIEEDEVEE